MRVIAINHCSSVYWGLTPNGTELMRHRGRHLKKKWCAVFIERNELQDIGRLL